MYICVLPKARTRVSFNILLSFTKHMSRKQVPRVALWEMIFLAPFSKESVKLSH